MQTHSEFSLYFVFCFFSEIKDGIYRGIAVKFVSFDMTLNNSASVKVYMYLMDEYGVINNGDEAIAVMPGRCTCMTSLNSATSIQ